MHKYLVEQVHETIEGGFTTTFAQVIEAGAPREALAKAQDGNPSIFWAFAPTELEQVILDYLWEAADGSMVMIAVRRLPE